VADPVIEARMGPVLLAIVKGDLLHQMRLGRGKLSHIVQRIPEHMVRL